MHTPENFQVKIFRRNFHKKKLPRETFTSKGTSKKPRQKTFQRNFLVKNLSTGLPRRKTFQRDFLVREKNFPRKLIEKLYPQRDLRANSFDGKVIFKIIDVQVEWS